MIRRFRAIVQTQKEPLDREVLWYWKGKLLFWNNDAWEPFLKGIDGEGSSCSCSCLDKESVDTIHKIYEELCPIIFTVYGDQVIPKGEELQKVVIAWSLTQDGKVLTPQKVVINGTEYSSTVNYVELPPVTTDTIYKVEVIYKNKTYTGEVSVRFINNIYYGSWPVGTEVNEENVNLYRKGSNIQDTKEYIITLSLSNEVLFYSYPKKYGELSSISDGKIEYINSFNRKEILLDEENYFVYILKDPCTVTDYSLTFK